MLLTHQSPHMMKAQEYPVCITGLLFKEATTFLQSQAVISIAIVNKIHDDIQLSPFLHWLLFVQKIFSWAPFCIGCFLAATKQLYKWYFPSVRPSVCPSHLFDYVPIIVSSWNFQELLPVTEVTSMQKVKVRGQRSRSQRSQPNFTVSGL